MFSIHVVFPVTEGKGAQGVQGVPCQPKMQLYVLKLNMLPQWQTKDPRANFVLCFLTAQCYVLFISSPMLWEQHS